MAGVLQHLRSSTLNKRPNPASMVDGQIAINYASGSPGAFFKDTNGNLVKVGPVHVGATAPNVSPASGGTAGNSLGEQWLDTSGGTYVFKIWDGAAWRSEAGEFVNSTGDTMTGSLTMGPSANLIFEGSTDDGFETTLTVVDPTADRTITLPNVSGTVVTTGDSGTVTSTMIADGTIVNADVNASAAIAGTKISPDFGSQTIQTTGVFSHAVGSTGAPTITFTGDTNTGIYSPGADQVAISTGGSGRLFVDASGNIGVGTTPDARFTVQDGTSNILRAKQVAFNNYINEGVGLTFGRTSDGAETMAIGVVDVDKLTIASREGILFGVGGGGLYSAVSEAARIDSSGRVGIGTSSPAKLLEVNEGDIQIRNSSTASINTLLNYGLTFRSTNQIGQDRGTIAEIKPYLGGAGDNDFGLQFRTQATTGGGVTTKMTLTPGGSLGIGTTSPTDAQLYVNSSAIYGVRINHATLPLQSFLVNGTQAFSIGANSGGGGSFYYGTGNVEAVRIDSSGRLLVGTSSARSNFYNSSSYSPRLQLESANDGASSSIALISVSSGGFDEPNLVFAKSRGSAIGNNTIVVDGDDIGNISFQASDGSEFVVAASILAEVDGTPGANDMPGRLVFSTTADGASSPTERMRINKNGEILFGTSTTTNGCKLALVNTDATRKWGFGTIGTNTYFAVVDDTSGAGVQLNAGSTSWSTFSDERLKDNLAPIQDGLDKVSQLRAVTGRYKTDDINVSRSFLIAQDVQAVLPEAVDVMSDDMGTLSLKYTEVIPLLVSALKESKERIETLEAKVAALESA